MDELFNSNGRSECRIPLILGELNDQQYDRGLLRRAAEYDFSFFNNNSLGSATDTESKYAKVDGGYSAAISLLSDEIRLLRAEIAELNKLILEYERSTVFHHTDVRYNRWVSEKKYLQQNLHEVLLSVAAYIRQQHVPSGVYDQQERTGNIIVARLISSARCIF
jgi:hypothetical protein